MYSSYLAGHQLSFLPVATQRKKGTLLNPERGGGFPHTLNQMLLLFKVPWLDSHFVLLLQANTPAHLEAPAACDILKQNLN